MNDKVFFSSIVLLYNELMNFIMMIGINILMFGVVLGCISVIGQYFGRIFDESKGRQIYIIENTQNYNKTDKEYNIII